MQGYYWSPSKKKYVERPRVIERITRQLEFGAFLLFLVGGVFILSSILFISKDPSLRNLLIPGILALLCGLFVSKLGKDFYRLKRWAYWVVRILTFLVAGFIWYAPELARDEVREAFESSSEPKLKKGYQD